MRKCLDCGKPEALCCHPSIRSILGAIEQSGRYIWHKLIWKEPPAALLWLLKYELVMYVATNYPNLAYYKLRVTMEQAYAKVHETGIEQTGPIQSISMGHAPNSDGNDANITDSSRPVSPDSSM